MRDQSKAASRDLPRCNVKQGRNFGIGALALVIAGLAGYLLYTLLGGR